MEACKKDKPILGSALEKAVDCQVGDRLAVLAFKAEDRFHAQMVEGEQATVSTKASAVFGHPLAIEVKILANDARRPGPSDDRVDLVRRIFRGALYHITVKNPRHRSKGVSSLTVDGKDASLVRYRFTRERTPEPLTVDKVDIFFADDLGGWTLTLVAPEGEDGLADYVPSDPRDFPDVLSTFWAYKHVEYCVEDLPAVFDRSRTPWIDPDAATVEEIIALIERCPSGALSYSIDGVEHRDVDRPPAVVTEKNGPFLVEGGVEIVDAVTAPDASAEHCTLCRCGQARNKPFCDGSHDDAPFEG